jgi:hypothetical protein
MVEVFKTNIKNEFLAEDILQELSQIEPSAIINFDLTDCDRILRVESEENITNSILAFSKKMGFFCQVLDDHPIIS